MAVSTLSERIGLYLDIRPMAIEFSGAAAFMALHRQNHLTVGDGWAAAQILL